VSQRRLCKRLGINRSSLWRISKDPESSDNVVELASRIERNKLVEAVGALVKRFPTWGYRRLRAWLVRREGFVVSRKTVQRIVQENRWQVHKRNKTPRPRVQHSPSAAEEPNQRWAIDATSCWSQEGWIGIMAVIDCCTRQIVGVHVSKRGRAVEAEMALEQGCLAQFGLLYAKGAARPVLRSDNGKVFVSKRFVGRCKQYGLSQEFITPYSPQQNGMIERWFRSLKEECIWLHNFQGLEDAKETIEEWVRFYNKERPHQSLDYLIPNPSEGYGFIDTGSGHQ